MHFNIAFSHEITSFKISKSKVQETFLLYFYNELFSMSPKYTGAALIRPMLPNQDC